MRIDAHEQADRVRLRREPGGALRSNYKPSAGQYALNGKGRASFIDNLERQRDQLFATGDKDGAKRYAIQAEFERASQIADNHQRQADATSTQEHKDEHVRRAQEARGQMTQTQLKMAELDKRSHTEWESTAEIRTNHFSVEVEQRKAEERKLADQLAAERGQEDYQRQVEAREVGFRERIVPERQQDYDALVDDVRRRFADTHGKDPESYTMSDRERDLTHKLIVDQGYGQDMRVEQSRIREANPQAPTEAQSAEPRLDPQRFIAETDRAAAESPRNDQYLRQPAAPEQAQRREIVESEKLREAGYVAERHTDHISYSKDGNEKPAVRDYGHRISTDPKQLQSEESRREVVAMVAERFPDGFNIKAADEERKMEYAREAVRQGHGDKIKNPELRDFIGQYKQQYAEEQRLAPKQAETQSEVHSEAMRQTEPPLLRANQAEARPEVAKAVQERSPAPEMSQRDADRLARRQEQRDNAQVKVDVLNNQGNLTDTQRQAFTTGLASSRGHHDFQERRDQEMNAYRQAAADLNANEQLSQRAAQEPPELPNLAERVGEQRPVVRDPLNNPSLGATAARPELSERVAPEVVALPKVEPTEVSDLKREAADSLRSPSLGGSPLDSNRTEPAREVEPTQQHAQRNDAVYDWGPNASDRSDSMVREKQREASLQRDAQPIDNPTLGPTLLTPTQTPEREDARQERAGQEEGQAESAVHEEADVASDNEVEGQVEVAQAEGEPDFSHLPDEVAEQLRESMAMEAQLAAQREEETQHETQQQSNSQTL